MLGGHLLDIRILMSGLQSVIWKGRGGGGGGRGLTGPSFSLTSSAMAVCDVDFFSRPLNVLFVEP